jgi:hypothetical protein
MHAGGGFAWALAWVRVHVCVDGNADARCMCRCMCKCAWFNCYDRQCNHLQHDHVLNADKMLTGLLTYLLPRHRLARLREEDARCPAADITNTVCVTCRF